MFFALASLAASACPHFIAGMNRLIDEIGIEATLVNKYRHRTKGEMVAACADPDLLGKEVGNSMSCSSPAKARYKGFSLRHCGYCVNQIPFSRSCRSR